MRPLLGDPAGVRASADICLNTAADIDAAVAELRVLSVTGESAALDLWRAQTTALARSIEDACERYRRGALALRDYASAIERAHARAEHALELRVPLEPDGAGGLLWQLDARRRAADEVGTAAAIAVAAIDVTPMPPQDFVFGQLALGAGLLTGHGFGYANDLGRHRAPPAALTAARRLRADSLDGSSYRDRDRHHRMLLTRLLAAGPNVPATTRERLVALAMTIASRPNARLISLWLDGDEPRAAIAFGDPERAESVTYVVHGINTDTADAREFASTVEQLFEDAARRPGRHESFIAWLGYDSGGVLSEPGIALADAGARLLVDDVAELRRRNPDAAISGVFHSYGSTTYGQSLLLDPRAFDEAYLLGSPGLSPDAARELEIVARSGTVEVHVSQARSDAIARIGTLTTWEHPHSPAMVPGVEVFSAEGPDAGLRILQRPLGSAIDYDPGTGGVDGHDLDRPEGAGADHFGYLTRDAASYRYLLDRITKGD
ncbi:MAG TPA: alpha/beta hydrolase [Microbacteriaceae bacterium]|nr:alpha/beta hydrolase [Microbacteriaceae bacterium]